MPPPLKKAGKASYFQYAGTRMWITKYAPKVTAKNPDTTDSADYDATTDLVYPSQTQASVGVELSVEGFYDFNGSHAPLMTALFTGTAGPAQVVLGRDAGNLFGSGKFNISDYSEEEPIEETVKFSCSLKSNGKFTPGA